MICSINRILLCCSYRSAKRLPLQSTITHHNYSNNNSKSNDIEFGSLTFDDFSPLITSEYIKQKIERILYEYEHLKYTTMEVSSTLTLEDMRNLLDTSDDRERKQMFKQLLRRETIHNERRQKKLENSAHYFRERNERWAKIDAEKYGIFDNSGKLIYGLWRNTLFTKILRCHANRLRNARVRHASLFGQKLVIDMGFDGNMSYSECRSTAIKLKQVYDFNKNRSVESFDLHFTNCDNNSQTMEIIKRLPKYGTPQFLLQSHSQSYLELFPRQSLVYLTPDSRQTLTTFDHNAIYIIGGFEENIWKPDITYAKAMSEGIRAMKLPIDDYLIWSYGRKSLPISQVARILHDIKVFGDWKLALTNSIPDFKFRKTQHINSEEQRMFRKLNEKRFRLQQLNNPLIH